MNRSLFTLPSGFDRDLKLLLFSMASRRIVMGFLMVVRAIYFYLLGFNEIEVGLLLSIATFVSAIHHITFGMLADRFSRKPFLILGGIFATLRLVIFALSSDFWMLALGQGIGAMGEGAGAGQPVVSGYIADKVDANDRVSIFSTMAMTNAIAATIGSSVAGLPQLFQNILNIDLVSAHIPLYIIGAAFMLLSLVIIIPLEEVPPKRSKKEEDQRGSFKIKNPGVILKFSLVRSTSGLGWGLIESLLTLYFFIRFAVGSDVLGPIYAGARLATVFTYLLIPFIVSRIGEIGAIVWSRLISAAVTAAFALTDWYPLAVALLIIFRIALTFTMPIRQSFALSIVDPEEISTAIGISNFARMGVRSIAPTLAGYMFEAVSLSMPFRVPPCSPSTGRYSTHISDLKKN
jgi:MFS family permease